MKNETTCARCFGILGVQSRMKIFNYLKDHGKSSVTEVVEYVKLTQPTVSYHLKEMKTAGLVDSVKTGKEVFYTVSNKCPSSDADCVLSNINFTHA